MSLMQIADHSPSGAGAPAVPSLSAMPLPSRANPRRELVARVMTFLRDNLGEPITVGELSRLGGVSERTLRAAFHDVIGLSPKQYAIAERLRAAHAALCAAAPGVTTVTDVAMTYGFFELGRFAKRYREAFGEVPSQTLHRGAMSWPVQAA